MEIFTGILAIFKAIPVLDQWLEKFVTFYVEQKWKAMLEENRAAIRKALVEHDQRDIEKAIGNPEAGEPSKAPGVVIVDHPPPNIGNGIMSNEAGDPSESLASKRAAKRTLR